MAPRYYVDGGERSKTFDRKVDAERFLATVQTDLLRGASVDVHDPTTVAEYARRWAAAPPAVDGPACVEPDRDAHRGNVLGTWRLASVMPSDVQAWATTAPGRSPGTMRLLVSLAADCLRGGRAGPPGDLRSYGCSPAGLPRAPARSDSRTSPTTRGDGAAAQPGDGADAGRARASRRAAGADRTLTSCGAPCGSSGRSRQVAGRVASRRRRARAGRCPCLRSSPRRSRSTCVSGCQPRTGLCSRRGPARCTGPTTTARTSSSRPRGRAGVRRACQVTTCGTTMRAFCGRRESVVAEARGLGHERGPCC